MLSRVDEGAFATLALSGELDRSKLASPDRALATELVYGVLRQRLYLDSALAHYAPRGLDKLDRHTRNVLRIAALQILMLRVPAHAAVDDAVEACKKNRTPKLAGFCNALLRNLATSGMPQHLPRSARLSAPDWLLAAVDRALPNKAEADAFLVAINEPPPLWLRCNRRRGPSHEVQKRLLDERPAAKLVTDPRAPYALSAVGLGDPSRLRIFTEGFATPQDLAAQLVVELARPKFGERALDVCAGVGGKSLDLAERGLVVRAVDQSARKLSLLDDTAHRLGLAEAITMQERDARTLRADEYGSGFDVVLVDAPCSGLGVLRRHPEAKWRPLPDISALATLQREILFAAASQVQPGGRLVYSVCSFLPQEGDAHVQPFLAAHPDFHERGIQRTWPHSDGADAFFAVALWRGES